MYKEGEEENLPSQNRGAQIEMEEKPTFCAVVDETSD
jgi:hypothetical protein